jgi:hypothetical protein
MPEAVVNAMIKRSCDRTARSNKELLRILVDFIDELGISSGKTTDRGFR